MNDFSAALNSFQAVQRRVSEKEKESIARARAGSRQLKKYHGMQPRGGIQKPTAVSTHTKVKWTSNLARNLWVEEDPDGWDGSIVK